MTSAERRAVFPLNTVLYPGGPLPLRIFEPRYVDMVSECMRHSRPFVVSAIVSGKETGSATFQDIGTLATIVDFQPLPDGLLGILVKGGERVRLTDSDHRPDGLNTARAESLAPEPGVVINDDYKDLLALLRQLVEQIPPEYYPSAERRFDDASWTGFRLAELLPFGLAQKQYFLEMTDPLRRLDIIRPLLASMQSSPQA